MSDRIAKALEIERKLVYEDSRDTHHEKLAVIEAAKRLDNVEFFTLQGTRKIRSQIRNYQMFQIESRRRSRANSRRMKEFEKKCRDELK